MTHFLLRALLGAGALWGIGIASATAGVIRSDVPDASYTAIGDSAEYDAVGRITFGSNYDWGSGTLVAGRWVLTAAHLVRSNFFANTPGNVRFTVGGNTYVGDQIFLHPGYIQATPSNGNDIALVRLSAAVGNVDPIGFYTGSDELGQMGTFVGFGRTGTGLTGQVASGPVKRGGTNDIDLLASQFSPGWSSNVLLSDFDSPLLDESSFGSSIPTDFEYLPAEKDSGAGLFLEENGEVRVAGVVSFALFDADGVNFNYGDGIAATRVSGQLGWITSVVPETSSVGLVSLGLALLILHLGVSRARSWSVASAFAHQHSDK
jgi:secreted trypsin-like serine protease